MLKIIIVLKEKKNLVRINLKNIFLFKKDK